MIRRTTASIASLALAATIALAATSSPALARSTADEGRSSGSGVTIMQVDASRFPTVRVAFGADDRKGETPPLAYFENGEPLNGVSMYRGPLGKYEDATRTDLMLVFDTSLSMGQGTRFEDAVSAARELVGHAREGDRIGLATFGGDARVVVKPTAEHREVGAALEGLELENRTTMFDGVSLAAQAFDREAHANRAMVLLSDGTDAGSVETIDEAAGEALKAKAPVFAVAIRENEGDQPRDLADLGNRTGGELQTVVGTDGLETMFDDLGRRILQPYWVEYRSSAPMRSVLDFGIAVGGANDRIVAKHEFRGMPARAASGLQATSLPAAKKAAEPILPMPGGLLGVLLASVPFAALIFLGTWRFLEKRSRPDVIARIERYTARASAIGPVKRDQQAGSSIHRLARPIIAMSESLLGRSRFFARSRFRAEQAAIAIKPSELFAAMVVMCGFGVLVSLLVSKLLLYVVLPVVFGMLPNVWLRWKARKRRNAFEVQLADVLGGISSSLKAGHSFNQAINAMIKDAPNPTSEEFSRVMTEARLGMPTEVALQHMADRMGSADFDFAVTTVNIQRTVGGSLADILEMVGDTVRNRQQFRKKVKALTSMGQMSAYVLLGMPIFIGAALTLINGEYMQPLFTTSTGHMLMAIGAFSMTLGYFACMKVVSVKV